MKYWFDTEFIEDGMTIDMISIGIVAEDGREYYAISSDFDGSKASPWVLENVLKHLPPIECKITPMKEGARGVLVEKFYPSEYRRRRQIRNEVLEFIGSDFPEFWSYYADYDWVALCQLFGRMIYLPKGWPMYCRDVKQLCDDLGNPALPEQKSTEHHALNDARWTKQAWEFLKQLPPPQGAM